MQHTIYKIKQEATSQIIHHGRLINDVALDFGISNKQLYQWLREINGKQTRKKLAPEQQISNLKLELSHLAEKLTAVEAKLLRAD